MKSQLSNNKNRKWLWALVGMVYLIPLVAVQGAVDYFLKIEGVEGESESSSKHKGEIDILSFSWGMTSSSNVSSGAGGGKLTVGELQLAKRMDKTSPILAKGVASGKVYPKVEINIVSSEPGQPNEKYLTYKLENVLISSYGVSGSQSDNTAPRESLSLNFTKMEFGYADYDVATGSPANQTNVVIIAPTDTP